jgi:hypothetical protein
VKYIVTVNLLVETENDLSEVDLSEVEGAFMISLINGIDGIDGTFHELISNPEYDDMALDHAPDSEEEEEGYYEADSGQDEEDIEQEFTWAITDGQVDSIQAIPHEASSRLYSVQGYINQIEAAKASK